MRDEFDVSEIPIDFLDGPIQIKKRAKVKKQMDAGIASGKRTDHAASRRREAKRGRPAKTLAINSNAQEASKAWEIWEMKRKGVPVYEISQKLSLPINSVLNIIKECFKLFNQDIKEAVEIARTMDLQTCDELLGHYLEIAKLRVITIQQIENGEPVSRDDVYAPMYAAKIVLEILKHRSRIMGYQKPEQIASLPVNTDMLVWLQQRASTIDQIVDEQPIELAEVVTQG